jgi:hypothetical protein
MEKASQGRINNSEVACWNNSSGLWAIEVFLLPGTQLWSNLGKGRYWLVCILEKNKRGYKLGIDCFAYRSAHRSVAITLGINCLWRSSLSLSL